MLAAYQRGYNREETIPLVPVCASNMAPLIVASAVVQEETDEKRRRLEPGAFYQSINLVRQAVESANLWLADERTELEYLEN